MRIGKNGVVTYLKLLGVIIMPYQTHESLRNEELINFNYGFFTNEKGSSAGGFIVDGLPTRNVNIYAPKNKPGDGYDGAENVSSNIVACIKELDVDSNSEKSLYFFMTANYAGMTYSNTSPEYGKLLIKVINNDNVSRFHEESFKSSEALIDGELHKRLSENNIVIVKSDAIVLTKISREDINNVYIGGFSADAHPIILLDDKTVVCAYIAASHHVLSCQGLQEVVKVMVDNGAKLDNIQVIIGPGLGKQSYETPPRLNDISVYEYLGLNSALSGEILVSVKNEKGEEKFLLNTALLLRKQAVAAGLPNVDNSIHDMELDTMGYDLYQPNGSGSDRMLQKTTKAPEGVTFLFNSARRAKPDVIGTKDIGKYNSVARTASMVGTKRKRSLL